MAPDTAQLKFISNDATTGNTEYRPYIAVTPEPGRSLLLAAALSTVTFRRRRVRTA
ncbi:PEP-CTERM sorting domain-containing protein [Verrucomicrobium sp. BvORR106]|uniref:PEP-CTERM sorting domain-containing protein n=1 Tax=Verrucomicrobium sp. BvORR106 TaxID=1403819 RepID=UPI000B2578F0|nr:PEP-CTERM sorting domain-containing protein [Verrucomicrobium sp. BvORR106]